MIGPSVELSLPPASWFRPKFLYDFPRFPYAVAPPSPEPGEWTFKAPFTIDKHLYHELLQWEYPVYFGIAYLFAVLFFNSVNRGRDYKPFAISKTPLFKSFVLLHNIALALYSALTCAALVRALIVSFPGFTGEHGLPGAIDALCKINGPRGFGDAITYNTTSYLWTSKNHKILLGDDKLTPDTTDVGRIWNEGLAFWGWLFYVSKFYEVFDNAIIILQGKRVSTLQAYHHAGALMCMWAGIRYMSPPIWMFVMVNAGIHALMYSYYAATTAGARPSKGIKQTITTLQIIQFVVGMSFATAHLLISYSGPVSIAYSVRSILSGAPSAISSAAHVAASTLHSAYDNAGSIAHEVKTHLQHGFSSASRSSISAEITSSASSFASSATESAIPSMVATARASGSSLAASASSAIGALASKALADDNLWLKKLLYRAAGREALAEAITNEKGLMFGPEFDEGLVHRTVEQIKEEVRYRTEYQTVRCLDTEGQAFAIWLNVIYLLPLTGLFLNFFRKTYSGKKGRTVSGAAKEAARKTNAAFERAGKRAEKNVDEFSEDIKDGKLERKVEEVTGSIRQKVDQKAKDWGVDQKYENVKQEVREFHVEEKFEQFKEGASEKFEQLKDGASNLLQQARDVLEGGDADIDTGDDDGSEAGTETETTSRQGQRTQPGHESSTVTSGESYADAVKVEHGSPSGASPSPSKSSKKKKKHASSIPLPQQGQGQSQGQSQTQVQKTGGNNHGGKTTHSTTSSSHHNTPGASGASHDSSKISSSMASHSSSSHSSHSNTSRTQHMSSSTTSMRSDMTGSESFDVDNGMSGSGWKEVGHGGVAK